MTRKLHVQRPGALLRWAIALHHQLSGPAFTYRTVQRNYSVVRVLCAVLVHCTVRTVQCTRTFLELRKGWVELLVVECAYPELT